MIERRAHVRAPRLKPGKIVFKDRLLVYDCTLRNVSEAGACLLVANGFSLPGDFTLTLDGSTVRCNVAWRRPDRIGVSFQPGLG
jgi:hypothetical protein